MKINKLSGIDYDGMWYVYRGNICMGWTSCYVHALFIGLFRKWPRPGRN